MVVQELEQTLFEELGYTRGPGLLRDMDIPWPSGRAIPHINAALFLDDIPLAYFSRFSEIDPDAIQQLHKNVWSQSKAPLLFITLPHEIRIYNGYERTPGPDEELDTPSRLLQRLTGLTDHLTAQRIIRTKLVEENHYERIYLETGAFWNTTEGQKINYRNRADRHLVEGMGQMRKLLIEAGLSNHVAYTLLGRSILIRYLEDRGALTSDWVEQMTEGQASYYQDALNSREITYLLFERLCNRFNGDLFPVEGAEGDVDESHLGLLLSFLNRTNLETGQLSLWPYNFEYIPIELISNIYDIFLDNRRASGAYYTPLLLADFILEETMGDDIIRPEMTVLDPACGSGIFLVGAFRRLIRAWRQANGKLDDEDLNRILQTSIFGVDKNPEAVRIAAFSLYLEILNHLSNEQIRGDSFQFPSLQSNLLDCDFFLKEVDEHFADRKFDRIVGNMPWGQGTLTKAAKEWLAENDYVVGGKQAAPAFMLRVRRFCQSDGEIAVLAPAKSTILVTSDTHQAFRDQFFSSSHVRTVVNFSPLVYELFPAAISPAVAMFYAPNPSIQDDKIVYGVPKPSSLSQHLKAIVLDTTEIKFLDLEDLLAQPQLWKTAMWGNPRDAALIGRLKSLPQLREQAKKLNWIIGEGIQIKGDREDPAPWLEGMNLVPTRKLRPYFVDMSVCEPIEERVFHRPLRQRQKLLKAPLVLIRQSQCNAAFSDEDIAYRHKISGVAGNKGQERLLKWLVAYINSSLAKYYHFLTSTSWAVERGTIIQWEYKEMPFPIPDEADVRLERILEHLDEIEKLLVDGELLFDFGREERVKEHEKAIDELVFDIFDLHPVERQLVKDMLEYGIGFFQWSKRKSRKPQGAKPVQPPDVAMLRAYANIFARTATSLLKIKNQTLNAIVYENGAPLTVVSFDLVDPQEAQPVQVMTGSDAMRAKLRELNALILSRQTPSMYMRRHVRVYDGRQVSLVRPSKQRFWTQSQARADADAFLAELLS